MKTTVNRIITLLLLAALPSICGAGGEWKQIDDKNGIALYSREEKGNPVAQFKGVCIVNRSIEAVGSVLSDIPSYPEWFFKCMEAKKIPAENSSELHFFLYVAIDTPWPFLDRDVCFKTDVTIDYAWGKVMIRSFALKEPIIPLRKRFVRITDSEHQWILERMNAHRTRITFINRTDAAGPFSNYLSNPGIRDTVGYSLENLEKMLNHPDAAEKIQQKDSAPEQ